MSNLDQKIENVANKIEFAANKAWKKRSFRIVSKSISAIVEVGLVLCIFLKRVINQLLPVCLA